MKNAPWLFCFGFTALLAQTPRPAADPAPPPLGFKIAPAPRDYLWTMIACDEREERFVETLYDAFLLAAEKKELGKDQFKVPARFAERIGPNYIFERAYYLTPNNLKGFVLAIPADCITLKDGMLSPSCPMVVVQWEAKQGQQILTLKRKAPDTMLRSRSVSSPAAQEMPRL